MLYGGNNFDPKVGEIVGLNPYFFGKCSTAYLKSQDVILAMVLILIFLENALRQVNTGYAQPGYRCVLILIFLENALRHNN